MPALFISHIPLKAVSSERVLLRASVEKRRTLKSYRSTGRRTNIQDGMLSVLYPTDLEFRNIFDNLRKPVLIRNTIKTIVFSIHLRHHQKR